MSKKVKSSLTKREAPLKKGAAKIETNKARSDSSSELEDAINSLSVSIWALEEGGEELVDIRTQLAEPEMRPLSKGFATSQSSKAAEDTSETSVLPMGIVHDLSKK